MYSNNYINTIIQLDNCSLFFVVNLFINAMDKRERERNDSCKIGKQLINNKQ